MSAHVARLRAAVGHELLLLPSVSVLPVDEAGRVLLVQHAGHHAGVSDGLACIADALLLTAPVPGSRRYGSCSNPAQSATGSLG
jgi:hypothetical protein